MRGITHLLVWGFGALDPGDADGGAGGMGGSARRSIPGRMESGMVGGTDPTTPGGLVEGASATDSSPLAVETADPPVSTVLVSVLHLRRKASVPLAGGSNIVALRRLGLGAGKQGFGTLEAIWENAGL